MLKWVSNKEIRDNLGLTNDPDLEKTQTWIARLSESKNILAMAIEVDNVYVGNVVLDQMDKKVRSARLSIYIGDSSARGRGVGSHSISHALKTAFQSLELNKVWLTVHCKNSQAINAYIRCGFLIEGVRRQEFALANRLVDCFHMGILAGEWCEESNSP